MCFTRLTQRHIEAVNILTRKYGKYRITEYVTWTRNEKKEFKNEYQALLGFETALLQVKVFCRAINTRLVCVKVVYFRQVEKKFFEWTEPRHCQLYSEVKQNKNEWKRAHQMQDHLEMEMTDRNSFIQSTFKLRDTNKFLFFEKFF